MEERSLKVLPADTTFFNKISSTLTKLLIPTKLSFNSVMINIKRNGVLKNYSIYKEAEKSENIDKKDQYFKRYEESYALYLESIDKFVMDSIYKKVKNGVATQFEMNAMSNYYTVVRLKDTEYLEYKYRKQKFLLELDYESVLASNKEKIIEKYQAMYVEKIDSLFKGILKNYSVKLADGRKSGASEKIEIYKNIFWTLEEYIRNVLPIKIKIDKNNTYKKIITEYEEFDKFTIGKLDEKDFLEKNMILLGLSRSLFTYSLPLVAAEQCYQKLLKDTRNLIMKVKTERKREEAYQMLLKLVEDYNVKLLSTKVYWDKLEEREAYKKFWNVYSKSKSSEEKEILSLRRELYELNNLGEKWEPIRKFYRSKLVGLGKMRELKNNYKKLESNTRYIKK
ncbi:MAG: hypothetical protein IKM97_04315 [Clostridia bacterium]|nr:hypothetical protein [Clostridia bacterium]